MLTPFPGIDPYLENPSEWEGFHTCLIVEIMRQLQPQLVPRYVATVEQRVFLEGRKNRHPDISVRDRTPQQGQGRTSSAAVVEPRSAGAFVVDVEEGEIKQRRIEIHDRRHGMALVTAIEVVSPTNKISGPGRRSYLLKQAEFLARDCHLVEIDLIRKGRHVIAVPESRARFEDPDYDFLTCVNRWPNRR